MRIGSAIGYATRHALGMMAQAFLIVAIIATLVIGAAAALGSGPTGADSVFAAKGGNGRGGGASTATAPASLAATCSPCQAGTVVQFAGSGFDASQARATLNIANAWTATSVAADGTVSFDWPYFYGAGAYSATAYQFQGNKMVLVAETTVIVE